ncbi:MAG TPA: A24 family peptidase [Steroidobacteraceae bacterium]|nr:A24 family peptidase [Steroidobacteraceae bacterium]
MFLLGLVVGSFLNVVIYRLPIMMERSWRAQASDILVTSEPTSPGSESASSSSAPASSASEPAPPADRFTLATPRSACPACKTPIKAVHNIPVVSWLWLRGRCAACKAPISVRYPAVELATGLLSAWAAWHFGFGAAAACAIPITWALIALTGIDIDHQLLPDSITLPLLWAGLLAAVAIGPLPGAALPVSPKDAIIGAAAGYLSLWAVFHAFRLVTGKEGMGYGDFKLFAALGGWMGWKVLPLVILLSAATGALLGISMIVLRGRDRAAPMPFGPYLAAAGWLAMLYGHELVDGYLRMSGLRH